MDDPHAPSIYDVPPEDAELEARLDAEAMASYRSGRFIRHSEMREWLRSWGTDNPLPPPKPEPR
jgi:predicted transcriptional regulator